MTRPFPTLAALEAGVREGDRALIGRALTLVESRRPDHKRLAAELLARLSGGSARALRIGITGAPGVGKSTLIDALGVHATGLGHRVAVLAVDPSSELTGGSILGDKTRMARLLADPRAFIRPSPSGGTLGGIAARTREAMLVLEAAGYDVLMVETVGVGQSETAVRHLTDTFVLLALAGAGDELQGIKRGIMELADVVLVTKADGDNRLPAKRASAQLRTALRLLHSPGEAWIPPVLMVSALAAPSGLTEAWQAILGHERHLREGGRKEALRAAQATHWLWALIDERVRARVRRSPAVASLEAAVHAGTMTVEEAAERILEEGLGLGHG
jgi:LAO/AO transport system kinase